MRHQQTASNQGSVLTGQQNNHKDSDKIEHEGSTWIKGPNGQEYELNGTFKQTAAGWEATGTFIDKNGTSWHGTMTGTAKNMEAFQNNAKNGDEAVFQATSIDTSHLSRTHKTEENDIYQNFKEHNTRNKYSSGSETTEGDKVTIDNSKTDTSLIKIERGTVISDQGKSYSYNSSAIAQDIQSKHDANGSLDLIRQKYENMKEMEASGNSMAVAARADYEKAITAYSMAAAQGLPVSSSVGEGDDNYKGKDSQHYQDANWKAGVSGVGGNDGPLGAGVAYSEGEKRTNSFGSQESSYDKVSLDTTALKIRDAIENGFDSGVSNGKILNSLGDRETYR